MSPLLFYLALGLGFCQHSKDSCGEAQQWHFFQLNLPLGPGTGRGDLSRLPGVLEIKKILLSTSSQDLSSLAYCLMRVHSLSTHDFCPSTHLYLCGFRPGVCVRVYLSPYACGLWNTVYI